VAIISRLSRELPLAIAWVREKDKPQARALVWLRDEFSQNSLFTQEIAPGH
jgi:hypothetical protein